MSKIVATDPKLIEKSINILKSDKDENKERLKAIKYVSRHKSIYWHILKYINKKGEM